MSDTTTNTDSAGTDQNAQLEGMIRDARAPPTGMRLVKDVVDPLSTWVLASGMMAFGYSMAEGSYTGMALGVGTAIVGGFGLGSSTRMRRRESRRQGTIDAFEQIGDKDLFERYWGEQY